MTPVEVIRHAKEIGLAGLSITDHDTVEAYRTAIPEAKAQGILLGTGVEFSSDFQGTSVHVLGYDFDLTHPSIHAHCDRHKIRRRERNQKILQRLAALRMPLEEAELAQEGTIGRPHIAQLMVKHGYVKSIKEAFELYIGDGKRCFDPGVPFSAAETLDIIHAAGGKAFIAHPHLMENGNCVKQLLALPFDGIECHYARCTPEKERRWVKLAQKQNLLTSGGSDFHGKVKEHIPLGCSWVDESTFNAIFQKLC
jgi:predicted metal-dependent phosphoesterase TrpH